MTWRDRLVTDRDRSITVAAMQEALSVMDGIMADPLVSSQRGYAYTDDDVDVLRAGQKALENWRLESDSMAQRLQNQTLLDQGGRAVSRAEMMLRRQGFDDVRSAGDKTLHGDAFNDSQMRVVEDAWERYQAITVHQRN